MLKIFKAPAKIPEEMPGKSIFLAGSIDMGKAINWQTEVEKSLENYPFVIFNPRRDDWDSSWKQDISNAQFREQVTWELDNLDRADAILFFFDKNGKAPITLLELGHYIKSGKCVVCCPEGFWRRGNVQILCDRYQVPLYENISEAIEKLLDFIRSE
jgi:nucleoside 2-deoxyribosyltransferase